MNHFKVADNKVQNLYKEMFGSVTPNRLKLLLKESESLPNLNSKRYIKRNKKGHMVYIVSTKGYVDYYDTDFYQGNWYFDGNKLGKKKRELVKAVNDDDYALSLGSKLNDFEYDKIRRKISKRFNF